MKLKSGITLHVHSRSRHVRDVREYCSLNVMFQLHHSNYKNISSIAHSSCKKININRAFSLFLGYAIDRHEQRSNTGTLTLYVNGEIVSSTKTHKGSIGPRYVLKKLGITIGGSYVGHSFAGYISETRLWSCVRSALQC